MCLFLVSKRERERARERERERERQRERERDTVILQLLATSEQKALSVG